MNDLIRRSDDTIYMPPLTRTPQSTTTRWRYERHMSMHAYIRAYHIAVSYHRQHACIRTGRTFSSRVLRTLQG